MYTFRSCCYIILSFFLLTIILNNDLIAQTTKDSLGYKVFDPLGQDSIPDSPTFQSILKESPGKTINRALWYRFGPKIGLLFPVQKNLIRHFNSIATYITADFLYSRAESGFGPALDYYNIARNTPIENMPGSRETKHDRFYIIAPSYTYQHFFFIQPDFLPYIEIDAKYIVGQLRVNNEHINTGLRSSFGASFDAGALLSDRFKLNFSYLVMRPIQGYSLSGLSATLSFLFYPIHTW